MYYYNNELPPQQGWICPKCGRVNAPWLPTCGCVSSQTSGSGTPYLVKTSSISRDSHEIATDEPKTERYCTNCKHNGVIADYECRDCCGMDHHEFIEPQTDHLVKTPSKSRDGHEIADAPLTDAEITELAKEIVHKMIDNSVIAEDAYPGLRQRMHEAVERLDEYYPSEDERSE